MKSRKLSALCGALLAAVLVFQGSGLAQVRKPAGVSAITPADMKEWLSYIASDQLQGRQVFTEGLGLAGSYIADHLKAWGVKPDGDNGSYFQVVKVLGVNVKRNSSVTVTVNGQTRTFKDGEGVTFPANAGGKQTVSVVGSDRISTELHNVNEESNAGLEKADKARLRDERSGGPRVDLHAQRSLQLCVQGDPDHLLHDGPPPRLSLRDR